jgi:hypothetical protein
MAAGPGSLPGVTQPRTSKWKNRRGAHEQAEPIAHAAHQSLGKTQSLTYRGKTFQGVAGDTVATALFANGVRIFARSLKYHRPRGLYSLDGECSNTCMDVNGIPNVRTENTLLEDGMTVKEQNVVGSAQRDWLALSTSWTG